MNKSNMTGLAIMAAASVALIAASGPAYRAMKDLKLRAAADGQDVTTAVGEADGYGGLISAKMTLAGDKIIELTLTGDQETAEIGGAALKTLEQSILKAGTIDGVDAVSGATWTSKGVFAAINNAMGRTTDQGGTENASQTVLTTSGLSHGIGFVSNGRLGPGKDDQDVGVYSINEVVAYGLFDKDGRIADLEVDIVEMTTPNHGGNNLTGFPGQSYNADENHDDKVDTVLTQTDDAFLAQVSAWTTKREQGDSYKMNSGTWVQEMDAFEEAFKGMTIDEVKDWFARNCSDLNGRPLRASSDKEEDIKKYEALSEEDKASLDAISGATMSLQDPHGDILGAIERAYEHRKPMEAKDVAKVGLGITNTGRLGPGKDDKDTGVYSINTQAVGACFDAEGRLISLYTDVMEVATPNYDGEFMPKLTGFPGQSYNADENHDEKVDTVLSQTEDSFQAQIEAWNTKRERGNTYKLNSGTWADEMDLFENHFLGMTTAQVSDWFTASCSDLNGRPLHGTSDKEEDVKKYEALSDDQKKDLDAISGATMSLKDAHGDILGAITKAWDNAKDSPITVAE